MLWKSVALACALLAGQATFGASNRHDWSIAGEVGLGVGGLNHDAAVVLPIFKRGPAARLDFSLYYDTQLIGPLYLYAYPGIALTLDHVTFFRADYWTSAMQVPWGVELQINRNHALLFGPLANFEFGGTLKVNHPVGGTDHFISLSNPDLYQGFLAGGSLGYLYRNDDNTGGNFSVQVYRSTFNSLYIGGRVAAHIDFYTKRGKDADAN